MDHSQQIQEIVIEYFKDFDNEIVIEIVETFAYNTPTKNEKVSKIIEKFLEDNGVSTAYCNVMSDLRDKEEFSFFRSSMSERSMIQDIKIAMLNMSFNRLRDKIFQEKKELKKDRTNFSFLKKKLLEVFEVFNRNEEYIYGKEEDEELVNKVIKMKI